MSKVEKSENKPSPEAFPYMTPERPDFGPTQVKDPKKLRADMEYVLHEANRCMEFNDGGIGYVSSVGFRVLILQLRKNDHATTDLDLDTDGRYMKIVYRVNAPPSHLLKPERYISLARAGLAPDAYGNWHKYNWVEDPTKRVARQIKLSPKIHSKKQALERYHIDIMKGRIKLP
ncbi:MAG: hypothetical protein A2152_00515 [Candidatus Levybacteria bacterium RBG_16_35_6]|nr:MAG: hypothetical protein A2152_00515 [Candidatus Levybacteria bacterium RBG_16_35_6]